LKALIYSDLHIAQTSSIVRDYCKEGDSFEGFTTFLKQVAKTLIWVHETAKENDCKVMFNLGDTFDKPVISAMEASMLNKIRHELTDIPQYILVGNHDSDIMTLRMNVSSVMGGKHSEVITSPLYWKIGNRDIFFLPYITEYQGQDLDKYLPQGIDRNELLILSHNDIAGIQYGSYTSISGFKIRDIEDNCRLFINGHLHNQELISKKILNVGSVTGLNFSNDARRYAHGVWILDLETLEIEFIPNPHSLSFYKIDLDEGESLQHVDMLNNSVVHIRCFNKDITKVREEAEELKQQGVIHTYKIFLRVVKNLKGKTIATIKKDGVNHLEKFRQYVLENLENSEEMITLLNDILKEKGAKN